MGRPLRKTQRSAGGGNLLHNERIATRPVLEEFLETAKNFARSSLSGARSRDGESTLQRKELHELEFGARPEVPRFKIGRHHTEEK